MFGEAAYQGREEAEAGRGDTDKYLSYKPPLYDVEKFTVSGSSNLNLAKSSGIAKRVVFKR